jgi:hypothetical protein
MFHSIAFAAVCSCVYVTTLFAASSVQSCWQDCRLVPWQSGHQPHGYTVCLHKHMAQLQELHERGCGADVLSGYLLRWCGHKYV